jgi:hypothetical protein
MLTGAMDALVIVAWDPTGQTQSAFKAAREAQ